jgi:hypothetical protein
VKTPGHAVVNVAALSTTTAATHELVGPVLLGAVLPDVPIFALYVYGRLVARLPEERIWRELYGQRWFLAVVHGLHSFVVAGAGLAASWALGATAGVALFASMLLHALCDLPIHGEDAHRHLWPVSDVRYISKYSYWDKALHAREVALVEVLLVVAGAILVAARADVGQAVRALVVVVAAAYPVHWWIVLGRRAAR